MAADADAGRFTMTGWVTSVIDGDTVQVRLSTGRSERVRLVGIDAPERGACWSAQATAAASRLAAGRPVTLRGMRPRTRGTADGAPAGLRVAARRPGLGYQLIAGGFGKAYVYETPFSRLSAYRRAEATGRRLARSLWNCGRRRSRSSRPAVSAIRTTPGTACHRTTRATSTARTFR